MLDATKTNVLGQTEIDAIADGLCQRLADCQPARRPVHTHPWWLRGYAILVVLTGVFSLAMSVVPAYVDPHMAQGNESFFTTLAAFTTLGFDAMAPTTLWGRTVVMIDAGVGYLMFGFITGWVVGWLIDQATS